MMDNEAKDHDFQQIGRLSPHLVAELFNQPSTEIARMAADEGLFAQQGDIALATHDMQCHGVGGGDDDDAGQQAFDFEDNIDERGRQAGHSASRKGRDHRHLGPDAADNKNRADSATNGKGAIHGQIYESQDAEGNEYADAGERIAQSLPDRADIDIAERHEAGYDNGHDDATRQEPAQWIRPAAAPVFD